MPNDNDIWNLAPGLIFENEAAVETRLVLPLLRALGYSERVSAWVLSFATALSLRGYLSKVFLDQYLAARLRASKEPGIDFTLFPEACPFTVEQVIDDNFLPKYPTFSINHE